MGHALGIALVTLVALIFVLGAVESVRRKSRSRGGFRARDIGFAVLMSYGGIAFFSQILATVGGLWFIGPSFEWPVGVPDAVTLDSQGRRIAALTTCGRIQVYSEDGRFLRGWFVESSGGPFSTTVKEGDHIEVLTVRGRKRLLYSPTGELLERGIYHGEYSASQVPAPTTTDFHTPVLLWPFSHPFIAIAVAAVGIAGLGVTRRRERAVKQGDAPDRARS